MPVVSGTDMDDALTFSFTSGAFTGTLNMNPFNHSEFTGGASRVQTFFEWGALVMLGLSSMYLGFFAWYRGLSMAGAAYGGQVQQLQALLTLLWSALLLGEQVNAITIAAALVVVACVAWAQRSRPAVTVMPEE